MKCVEIMGGLGNQMFQYAFYLALKNAYKGEEVKIDTSYFRYNKCHNGYELESVFGLNDISATEEECFFMGKKNRIYSNSNWLKKMLFRLVYRHRQCDKTKPDYANVFYKEVFNTNQSYFSGWWGNELYFRGISNAVKKLYKFPKLDQRNAEFLRGIKEKETVSLHVRRGDYLYKENFFFNDICTDKYYKNAIEFINQEVKKPLFVVFSNDIEWCRKNLDLRNSFFVDWNRGENAYKDMQLMSLCKHNIIANSSFSWWGGYLNSNKDKIVCSPTRMMNIRGPIQGEFPDEWIRIDSM